MLNQIGEKRNWFFRVIDHLIEVTIKALHWRALNPVQTLFFLGEVEMSHTSGRIVGNNNVLHSRSVKWTNSSRNIRFDPVKVIIMKLEILQDFDDREVLVVCTKENQSPNVWQPNN